MKYPLTLRFKLLALASQISVKDDSGVELFYIKQKLFKFKEQIEIYRDSSKAELLFNLRADRVIDFSPLFRLTDPQDNEVGTIKRQGRASLWRATYDLTLNGQPFAQVSEANPWTKFFDGIFSEVPILGIFSGYVFHPRYNVTNPEGNVIGELTKRPGFLEHQYLFTNSQTGMDETTQNNLAVLMMAVTLRERTRG